MPTPYLQLSNTCIYGIRRLGFISGMLQAKSVVLSRLQKVEPPRQLSEIQISSADLASHHRREPCFRLLLSMRKVKKEIKASSKMAWPPPEPPSFNKDTDVACAGAMLIFSVSFQYSLSDESEDSYL